MTKFFCVFAFNRVVGDYECLGVYSIKEEADAFALTVTDRKTNIITRTWSELADMLFFYRMRDLVGPLTTLSQVAISGGLKIEKPTEFALYGDGMLPVDIVRGE